MSPQQVGLGQLLDLCARVEDTMAEIYGALAVAHRRRAPELAELWTRMAADERQHASQCRLSPAMLLKMISASTLPAATVQALLDDGLAILQRVRQTPPQPAAALAEAISLEERFIQVHMDQAFSFTDESHRRMFRAMMAADEAHVARLREALGRLP